MKRSEAREAAFVVVFEYAFGQNTLYEIFDTAKLCRDFEWNDYTQKLAEGVVLHSDEIDEKIKLCLRNWTIERISRPALAILRCAVWEIFYGGIGQEIAINEAVELAKKYAPDADSSFINGVLGRMVRAGLENDDVSASEDTDHNDQITMTEAKE